MVSNRLSSFTGQHVNVDEKQVTSSTKEGGVIQSNPSYLSKLQSVKQTHVEITLVEIIFHYSFLFACYVIFRQRDYAAIPGQDNTDVFYD